MFGIPKQAPQPVPAPVATAPAPQPKLTKTQKKNLKRKQQKKKKQNPQEELPTTGDNTTDLSSQQDTQPSEVPTQPCYRDVFSLNKEK